jgi:hypothetical protein
MITAQRRQQDNKRRTPVPKACFPPCPYTPPFPCLSPLPPPLESWPNDKALLCDRAIARGMTKSFQSEWPRLTGQNTLPRLSPRLHVTPSPHHLQQLVEYPGLQRMHGMLQQRRPFVPLLPSFRRLHRHGRPFTTLLRLQAPTFDLASRPPPDHRDCEATSAIRRLPGLPEQVGPLRPLSSTTPETTSTPRLSQLIRKPGAEGVSPPAPPRNPGDPQS